MQKIIEITKQRVKANEKTFNQEEMKIIQDNIEMASKIYSLGNADTMNAFLKADKQLMEVFENASI